MKKRSGFYWLLFLFYRGLYMYCVVFIFIQCYVCTNVIIVVFTDHADHTRLFLFFFMETDIEQITVYNRLFL